MAPVREHRRIYVTVPVTVSCPTDGDGLRSARTRQLGLGGCMITGSEYLREGRVVLLEFDLAGDRVRTVAQVLYEYLDRDGAVQTGVKFVEMEPADGARLDRFISTGESVQE